MDKAQKRSYVWRGIFIFIFFAFRFWLFGFLAFWLLGFLAFRLGFLAFQLLVDLAFRILCIPSSSSAGGMLAFAAFR